MNIKVIMALPSESQGLFEKELTTDQLFYCGVGKINAAFKTTEVILKYKPDLILNLGTAGSKKLKTHEVVECAGFVQRDMDISPLGLPIGETPLDDIKGLIQTENFLTHLQRGVCGTGDSFEVGPYKLDCDLVDMEAYAMAKVCKRLKTKFVSIKYITDGSDDSAHKDWVANLRPASEKLFALYIQLQNLKFSK